MPISKLRNPYQWGDFWRVWWHCLSHLWRDGGWTKHCMCELQIANVAIGLGPKWHFCNCGYLWERVPFDTSLWPRKDWAKRAAKGEI